MSSDDKALPRGALEEAASLFDDLRRLLELHTCVTQIDLNEEEKRRLRDLDSRRAALQARLTVKRPQKPSALAQCGPDGWPDPEDLR
jgi:hypothetical protein